MSGMSESVGASAPPFQTILEHPHQVQRAAKEPSLSKRSKSLNRKTSAEIVKEAKSMLTYTTPTHSTRSYSSMMSSVPSTLKFEGGFKGRFSI